MMSSMIGNPLFTLEPVSAGLLLDSRRPTTSPSSLRGTASYAAANLPNATVTSIAPAGSTPLSRFAQQRPGGARSFLPAARHDNAARYERYLTPGALYGAGSLSNGPSSPGKAETYDWTRLARSGSAGGGQYGPPGAASSSLASPTSTKAWLMGLQPAGELSQLRTTLERSVFSPPPLAPRLSSGRHGAAEAARMTAAAVGQRARRKALVY
jgi:hypothetical protein